MLLRMGLEVVDRIAAALPAGVAYRVADLAGDAWFRMAPGRRRLVAANLRRVCEATDRPTHGSAFTRLVRSAFRHHARYYLELLRARHYGHERIDRFVDVPEWPAYEAAMRSGACVVVTGHIGNFEPFGIFLARHGLRALSPIEEIEPRALFEFLAERRGGGSVELVPLRGAGAVLRRRLKSGGLVGIVGDRLLEGAGQRVTVFGHAVDFPLGPATLVVTHGAALVVGRCLRIGPDRFHAEGEVVEVPTGVERRAAIAAVTKRIAARFERDVAAAPDQWWGAFQPFWADVRP